MAGAAPDVDDAGRVQVERPDTSLGRWPANFIHDGLNEEWARFFYCAKTSKRDRNEGLEEFEEVREHDGRAEGKVGGNNPRNRTNAAKLNHHPTVKPTSLMQYLVRLVTPQGGTVLDPFMGSGSTGKACVYEGFNFIGIDQSSEYVEIARARIDFALDNIDADI
jgi:site-specific DNA-methyltransferase (adenine-specific)